MRLGGGPRTPDISLRYVPVVDGKTLPAHPFEPAASAISADIPMMLGSNESKACRTATLTTRTGRRTRRSRAELRAAVKQIVSVDDAEADRLIALYKSHRPNDSFGDLAAVMSGDNSALRTSAYTIAERKFAQGARPRICTTSTGARPCATASCARCTAWSCRSCSTTPTTFVHDRHRFGALAAIATAMSSAWVAFARTGNPSHPGLPLWRPFDPQRRATMVFNTRPRLVDDPYGDERRAMAAAR